MLRVSIYDSQHEYLIRTLIIYRQNGGSRVSSVGIATRYVLDDPGIESRWGDEIFRIRPYRPRGPPSLLYNGYRVFPGGKLAGVRRRPPIPIYRRG
jgi:hypothetical protein